MMAKVGSAERGWHVVNLHVTREKTVAIDQIRLITHWDQSGIWDRPLADGKPLYIDPCELRGSMIASFLMDPKGRLLGWGGKLVANSVFDLNEAYSKWRNEVHEQVSRPA